MRISAHADDAPATANGASLAYRYVERETPPPTTVYIAEDHPVFRDAVAQAIQASGKFELAGTAGDGPTALAEIAALRPDVAILDHNLPALTGIEVLQAIDRDKLPTRVMMLSADGSSTLVYEAMRLGGAAFLTKAASLVEICAAVAAVARGQTVLGADVQSGLIGEMRRRMDRDRPTLTERELEILRLISIGVSGPQIAARLFISMSTVKTHVKSIMEKLTVHDRAAAVAEAMRQGLIH